MSQVSTKVITGKVRFSYTYVWEPVALSEEEGSAKKYQTSILIPKTDKATIKKIEDAIQQALKEGKDKKFAGKIPPVFKNPLRDGDRERPDDPNYEGMMFLNARADDQPGIVDENVNPIMDKSQFYAGCYGRASLTFYAFNFQGNKGVAVALNNVQKLEDGEPLSGFRSSAEDDFGADDDLM